MIVSGRDIANRILAELKKEIEEKKLKPGLAIILAGAEAASRIYVENKLKRAKEVGIEATLYEFIPNQQLECKKTIEQLNNDNTVSGIIIQQPMYEGWEADSFINAVSSEKDVDGFKEDSRFKPATALGVWEMLSEFAEIEGFETVEQFLENKKIVVLGRGRTAGKPTGQLLSEKGYETDLIHSKTENPDEIIRSADVVISATGRKNIINASNIKAGSYVIGVGVGKEEIEGEKQIFGDINEEEVAKIAKLYCPTIGGIGPLTIACLLRNVVIAVES